MEKRLDQLLAAVFTDEKDYQIVSGSVDERIISSLVYDSKVAAPGALYFAWPGIHVHGNLYIAKAVAAGASAVIFQDELPEDAKLVSEKTGVPLIKVKDSRFIMAPVSAAFYDNPSKKLAVIGVTGTEGKSTTVFLIWQFLRLCGKKAGFFSTVQYSLGGDAVNNPEHQTTPESTVVQEKLYQMVNNGCEYAVVESSSHGLSKKLNRLGDVCFDVGIMMNVTSEHLEFHGTYEQYKSDKANLFRALDECSHTKIILGKEVKVPSFGIVKASDPAAIYFAECTKAPVYGFLMDKDTELEGASSSLSDIYKADKILSDSEGEYFSMVGGKSSQSRCSINDIRINLPGTFNVYNTMAAMLAVSGILGLAPESLKEAAGKLLPVKGRMTLVDCGQPFEVIVDYAHTPSSFMTIFPPLRERLDRAASGSGKGMDRGSEGGACGSDDQNSGSKAGRLIALFGSGGERDTKKRPEQGRIASEYCDIVILADEDPRGEDPMTLLEDIAAGCSNSKRGENLFLIPDRPAAIAKAFSLARAGDIVLLLGKAHENSIIYKDRVMPYDEISEAEKQLSKLYKKE
ncbi:MAG: UDP-N-acetylmuramyl-tripeptide synthetase [Treponemataceae bacterium]|nr:UDP-N-acetylmuramyl-tripeptide synthetase [Treponemataceae bacterium]